MDHILNYYCHLFTNLNIFKVKIELCENHVKIKHHAFRKIEFGCCFQQFLHKIGDRPILIFLIIDNMNDL